MFGINNYRNRRKLEVDMQIHQYRVELMAQVEQLALKCAKDTGDYEHTYHSRMEELGIEIAKMEALKEIKANDITTYETMIKDRDNEIDRLNTLLLEMAKSKIMIQK
jgi:hypothetical protein